MEKTEKFNFIRNNYGWIVTFLTILAGSLLAFSRFSLYVQTKAYFYYYGINICFYDPNNVGILFDFIMTLIPLLAFYAMSYMINDIFHDKTDSILKKIFKSLIIITINLVISFANSGNNWINFSIAFVSYFMVEALIANMIQNEINKFKKDDEDISVKKGIISVIYSLFALMILFTIMGTLNAINVKQFDLTENNKVVVYSTEKFYILADCKIESNKIIIYANKHTRVPTDGVELKTIKFNNVEVKK